jgi:hypothetical protein
MTDPQQAEPNVDFLDELEQLAKRAFEDDPSPWCAKYDPETRREHLYDGSDHLVVSRHSHKFIARLENALPQLLALARSASEAKARLERLESALEFLHKNAACSTSDYEPAALLLLAKQFGWTGKAGT